MKKFVEKFETQQKTIEYALESLENSSKQNLALNREEKWEERYWICLKSTKLACFIQKDGLKILLETADIEQLKEHVNNHKPMEYNIEYYYQKPLKECSLKEVIDGIVIISKLSNWFDTVDQTEDKGLFTLVITHSLGLNNSKLRFCHLLPYPLFSNNIR